MTNYSIFTPKAEAVLVIISKIYFLSKNFLIVLSLFKFLISLPVHVVNFNNTENKKNNYFLSDGLKGNKSISFKTTKTKYYKRNIGEIEQIMQHYGLVDISSIDSNIIVSLQYATTSNFLKKNIYGSLTHAYLQKDVAAKLVIASNNLIKLMPQYRIVVLDAARPLSLQQIMWNEAQVPENDKDKFIANPIYHSLHNYGAAVDITLSDTAGNWLDMGTGFDSFDDLAYPSLEPEFLKQGKLSPLQINNRLILRSAMAFAGFSSISTEWWHFNSCSRNYAKKHYSLIVSHILADNPAFSITPITNNTIREIKEPKANDINFRIQIMTSEKKLNPSSTILKGKKVDEYIHKGLYKYTYGKYKTLEDALIQLSKIRNDGFSDAFVVAFNKNERIGIKDASELLQ